MTKAYRPENLVDAIASVREDLERVSSDLVTSLRWVMSEPVERAVQHAIDRLAIHAETLRVIADSIRGQGGTSNAE